MQSRDSSKSNQRSVALAWQNSVQKGTRHALCIEGVMNPNPFKCPSCGGSMYRVKVLPARFRNLIRFRCDCGHCEDLTQSAGGSARSAVRLGLREASFSS